MMEWDTEGEELTGGYFVEVDNNASREPYWFTSPYGNPISVHEPDEDVIQPQQFNYIRNAWNDMESTVFSSDYTDKEKGLASVLDVESFCRHFLISEFNGNTDMLCQVFYYKERGDDHFYTGPIWDADLALENDQTTYPANERMDWTYKVRDTGNWTQFVGRVLSVTERTADVLLLSDANSRLSCVVETPAGALRGVVQGGGIARGDRALEMLHSSAPFTVGYLDKDAAVAPGARVLTSGLGGVYPAGLPVGVVAETGPDGSRLFQRAVVAPYVDFGSLRRVFVLRSASPAQTEP
jgi:hypothetical protein